MKPGEKKMWSVVHVPTEAAEDERQLHRELLRLKKERTRSINRMKGLLASQGVAQEIGSAFGQELERIRMWNGKGLPIRLRNRLEREYERMGLVEAQMKRLDEE
jgi:transposase